MPQQYDLPYSGNQVEALLAEMARFEGEIPEKTSDLRNDSGFVTANDLPTKTSDLQNDSGFITNAVIPTRTSQLNNDSGFITQTPVINEASRATAAETALGARATAIEAKIPSAASSSNQLADKAFVAASTSDFITRSVNNLANYYLKAETYTKEEVQQLISTLHQFTYEVVASLPTASAATMNRIYLVPSSGPSANNTKDEYITIYTGGYYAWEMIGNTVVDLSDYPTTSQMDAAISEAVNAQHVVLTETQYQALSYKVPGVIYMTYEE